MFHLLCQRISGVREGASLNILEYFKHPSTRCDIRVLALVSHGVREHRSEAAEPACQHGRLLCLLSFCHRSCGNTFAPESALLHDSRSGARFLRTASSMYFLSAAALIGSSVSQAVSNSILVCDRGRSRYFRANARAGFECIRFRTLHLLVGHTGSS